MLLRAGRPPAAAAAATLTIASALCLRACWLPAWLLVARRLEAAPASSLECFLESPLRL